MGPVRAAGDAGQPPVARRPARGRAGPGSLPRRGGCVARIFGSAHCGTARRRLRPTRRLRAHRRCRGRGGGDAGAARVGMGRLPPGVRRSGRLFRRRADRECIERVRVAVGDAPRPADGDARGLFPAQRVAGAPIRDAGPAVGNRSAGAVRLPVGVPVHVRARVPVGVRPRVSPGASPHASGRPCPSHGSGLRGGRVRALGRDGSVTGIGAGGLHGHGAVLGGSRWGVRRPEPVGIRGCRGRHAARACRARRRGKALCVVGHRVPAVEGAGGGGPRRRGVRAGKLAVELPVVAGGRDRRAVAVPRYRPAVVLGARGAGAAPARGGPGFLHAAAGARAPARGLGTGAGGGAGLAGGEPSGARRGRGPRGPAGAVTRRGGRGPAAGGRGPQATAEPPRRVDLSRDRRPAGDPGRRP